ncbi:MAG: hypothetical protein JSU70_10830 [Phycisphaerales bacterium]|nr:MAG: hypothetical protein JSU70_10830 [Phycisphaerales bacterium]
MTRRKFFIKVVGAGSAIVLGVSWLAGKASPRRFVRAVRTNCYPGCLESLREITKMGKWGG